MDREINTLNKVEEKPTQSVEPTVCTSQKRNHISYIFSSHSSFKKIIALIILVFMYGLYYWGIPAIINLPEKADFIEQRALKETGYKISLKNPSMKMGLLPSIWVKADNFSILNDDNSQALSIDKPFVK